MTERKQIKHESGKLLRLHQALMKAATEGIHIMDLQGNVIEANEAFCRMLGYTQEEMAVLNVADWEAQLSREELREKFKELIGKSSILETLHRRKDGALINVEISSTGVEMDGVDYIVSVSRDITESQRVRRETDKLLRRYQTLMKNSLDAIRVMDMKGNVVEANDAFCRMLGYTHEEALKLNIVDWDAQWTKEELQKRFRSFIGKKGGATFDTVQRRKDGTLINVEVTTTAIEIDGEYYFFASSRDITERKKSEQEIQQLAFYDSLTKLPNRRLLLDRLQQVAAVSMHNGHHGALMFLDLDHFKTINDTQGHAMGDRLLIEVALRLQTCVRKSDSVARLGGDEFVVLLQELSIEEDEAATQTELVAKKILDVLSLPYQLASSAYHCTASIGATLFSGTQQTIDELMKQADIAMYQSKKAGRNALNFFDPRMQTTISARASLESELRKALEFQQFHLHYQIQVDSSLRPLGAEALIRWLHPERGMVSPVHFIPLAEETGLILPIGLWVLESACAQIKKWQQDALTRDLVLAVNVSAKQFYQVDFVAQVQAALQNHAINPKLLKLELTESLLLENIEGTITTMNTLNELGVQFSLDDFGSGYSSLQYLKRLPLVQLKIDRSFISDIMTNINDKLIVHTIIIMAQSLGLDVIAEGVETDEQRQFLVNNNCTHFQGYLFGKPVPIEQFEALLEKR